MTNLPENIEELLTELIEKSRHEMNIVLALADAIRRTDEQLLREVRNVTLGHEMRRAEIRGELQALSSRLCAFPAPQVVQGSERTLHRPHREIPSANGAEPPRTPPPMPPDWPKGATDMDLEEITTQAPRH